MATPGSTRPWERTITGEEKLLTSLEETRLGFLEQAREKTRRATAFVQRAHELERALQAVTNATQLPSLHQFREDLIAAAGFSDKAKKYFGLDMLDAEMKRIFDDVFAQCVQAHSASGPDAVSLAFRKEIVYRYMLTRGDTLGGQMRNWTGARAGQRFNKALLEALDRAGLPPEFESSEDAAMIMQGSMFERDDEEANAADGEVEDAVEENGDAEGTAKNVPMRWRDRLLLFNAKPTLHCKGSKAEGKVVLNNIDMILLDTTSLSFEGAPKLGTKARKEWELRQLKQNPQRYLACGELKGGIDPAGADEHWKTATGGLARIPEKFKTCRETYGVSVKTPHLFFVGAAIGTVMASDVYARLRSGTFSHAANLTEPTQVAALTDWLVSL